MKRFSALILAMTLLGDIPAADPPEALPWLPRLADGRAMALQKQQPVFVRMDSASCVWCRKLEVELRTPTATAELARWTLVSLDAATAEKEARALAVGPTPALRILTPAGRVVASHDGFLSAEELVAWLRKHHDTAAVIPPDELKETEAPDAEQVVRLVEELKKREPELREAAIRRLLPYPRLAAKPVAEAFTTGSLQSKLGALELLREWQAPTADLDPWRPETLSPEAMKKLTAWAIDPTITAPQAGRELTAAERTTVQQDITRMLTASDAESSAIRERLARYGAALMPDVYRGLKEAITDVARERLTALRYRLVARDALVLRWPGGLDRIASGKPAVRRDAIKELARLVTQADEPLLLELFGDSDPLVRELSLRALHAISGKSATGSLTRLLKDPDPNVRAAVLKQLAESPSPKMVAPVADYAATEPDLDLVVHAVRVLRAAGGTEAVDRLTKLLRHSSWRVRADAIEALGETAGRNSNVSAEVKTSVHTALQTALADEDGFVVARALGALDKADAVPAIEPLLQIVRTHPDLLGEIIRVMSTQGRLHNEAMPHLREYARHREPTIRAKAIVALGGMVSTDKSAEELLAGLKDEDTIVRQAAAEKVLQLLKSSRSGQSFLVEIFQKRGKPVTPAIMDSLVEDVRKGKGRPAGFLELQPTLEAMQKNPDATERLRASVALIALAKDEEALPVLAEAIQAQPDLVPIAAEGLSWLPWPKRLEVFEQLTKRTLDGDTFETVIHRLADLPDIRHAGPMWKLLDRDDLNGESASVLQESLTQLLKPRYSAFNKETTTPEQRKILEEARTRAKTGRDLARLVALGVLVATDSESAADIAEEIYTAVDASKALRADAFQVLLVSLERDEAAPLAVKALTDSDPGVRRSAILFLAQGSSAIQYLRNYPLTLDMYGRSSFSSSNLFDGFIPWVPPGLDAKVLRERLGDTDPATAASAGYLLTLLGDGSGLPILTRHWRETTREDWDWGRLVTTAIACLEDDAKVPVLEEIYRTLAPEGEPGKRQAYEIREFYWRMRPLPGPKALRLRKLIRSEVGMEVLWR